MAAKPQQPELHARFQAWLVSHARAFVFSLGKLYRAPLANLMTILVITVALALPGTLFAVLDNAQRFSGQWDHDLRLSAFMTQDASWEQAEALRQRLLDMDEVTSISLIHKDDALERFKQESGLGDALSLLDNNPLPHTLIILPKLGDLPELTAKTLQSRIDKLPQVDQVTLDLAWLQRLHAIMNVIQRGVLLVAVMLGLTALLVVGNTIRLDILNRRQEIEVAKLIGATDGFIRRPFLYGGFWYGLLSALLALVTVSLAIYLLSPAVSHLSGLYGSQFQLTGLKSEDALVLLITGVLLGLLGSWLAVTRHLNDIEPR